MQDEAAKKTLPEKGDKYIADGGDTSQVGDKPFDFPQPEVNPGSDDTTTDSEAGAKP